MEKTLKNLAVIVYLHSQTQRFFVDVSFRFSNDRCRYTAIGNFVILLFRMQRVMNYLFALQDFDFDVSLGISGQLRQNVKEIAYTIITLPEAKRLMFLSRLPFSFRKRVSV